MKKIREERLRRKLKFRGLRKNKCQWKLPIEYKESRGVAVVEDREYRAKRKER